MATQGNLVRREYRFAGCVQGVGFRYTVRSLAADLPVTGFVRNLPNGQVQLVVEGTNASITALCSRIGEHMADYIDEVISQEGPPTGEFEGFAIRY